MPRRGSLTEPSCRFGDGWKNDDLIVSPDKKTAGYRYQEDQWQLLKPPPVALVTLPMTDRPGNRDNGRRELQPNLIKMKKNTENISDRRRRPIQRLGNVGGAVQRHVLGIDIGVE